MQFTVRAAATGAAILASTVLASSGHAVEPGGSAPSGQAAPTVFTRGPNVTAPAAAAQMRAAVQRDGELRVIVGLDLAMTGPLSGAAAAEQSARLSAAQQRVARRALGTAATNNVVRFGTIPFVALTVGPDALNRLLADPKVVSIQEDVAVRPTLSESVPLINGDDVVAKGFDGTGRLVAILDTGVSAAPPMLAGKIASEACFSSNVPAQTATSVCPGGVTESTATGSGRDCDASIEGCDHGTHVASIAAGNSPTLKGVAPGAQIVAIQVFSRFTSPSLCAPSAACALSFTSDQIRGLERVLALKASLNIDSVNMSLGGGSFTTFCDAQNPSQKAVIDNLLAAGVATAIASGNDGFTGSISSPACISTAITVGATTKSDGVAIYSNHNALIDLLAPGSSIRAAVPTGIGVKNGTSMATPHVAGGYALLRSVKPGATVAEILTALSNTGVPLSTRETGAALTTKPRIDLLAAATLLGFPPPVVEGEDWQFTDAVDGDDWSPIVGSWKVQSGFYRGKWPSSGWIASTAATNVASAKIVAELGRKVGKEKKFFVNSGVMFKTNFDSSTRRLNGYYAAYNACPANKKNECKPNSKNKPGLANLYRFVDYSFEDGDGSVFLLCARKAKVNVNGQNRIEITTTGSTHEYLLNGKLICSTTDAAFGQTGVAIAAFSRTKKAKELKIDFFTVDPLTPSDAPLSAKEDGETPAAPQLVAAPLPTSVMTGAGALEGALLAD